MCFLIKFVSSSLTDNPAYNFRQLMTSEHSSSDRLLNFIFGFDFLFSSFFFLKTRLKVTNFFIFDLEFVFHLKKLFVLILGDCFRFSEEHVSFARFICLRSDFSEWSLLFLNWYERSFFSFYSLNIIMALHLLSHCFLV